MQKLLTLAFVLFAATAAFASLRMPASGDAINAKCPIMKGPIDGATFVEYDGHSIGFCCPMSS